MHGAWRGTRGIGAGASATGGHWGARACRPAASRCKGTPTGFITALGLLAATSAAPVGAQWAELPEPTAAGYAYMETLLEKTIFQVDVLTLEVWIGGGAATPLQALRGAGMSDMLRDSVATLAVHARDAWARITFERGVSLDQFVGGIEGNMRRAVEAGLLDQADAEMILDSLPHWFDVLDARGIAEDDRLLYRVLGDTLRTRFVTYEGETLLDQTDVGPERRLSVFGSYYAPGSEFRKGLTSSLLDAG